jgi:hypothetical protein
MGMIQLLLAVTVALGKPVPAPLEYVTQNYDLRFRSPPHLTICPLPDDWVGSDHGTTLFLAPPEKCGGAGYPSSDRGFTPDRPRIEVFYAFWDAEDAPPVHCHGVGWTKLLGRWRRICRTEDTGDVRMSVQAIYSAGGDAEVDVALVTTPNRLAADLQTFRKLAATIQTCTSTWSDQNGVHKEGRGPMCPPTHSW